MLYRDRNAIERMFGRLKDFCRVATRYDKLAETFHATISIAAIVSYAALTTIYALPMLVTLPAQLR